MPIINSYINHLICDLNDIVQKMNELIDASEINEFVNDPSSGFVFISPHFYWNTPDDNQKLMQIEIKEKYNSWIEHVRLLFNNSPSSIIQDIDKADRFIKEWIEKKSSWSLPRTLEEAKKVFLEKVQTFYKLLEMLSEDNNNELFIIPDTNSIISNPSIEKYSIVLGREDYTVILVPIVLTELDELKVKSRDNDFREKVNSVINRIKGWRKQGSLLKGITINKTVQVKMIAKEPDFSLTLKWLDPTNADDRIITCILEIQRENPSSVVYLMTLDINLQNKAEMANIPFIEPPV
jgi:hypothetical protein